MASTEAIDLLRSIDASLKLLVEVAATTTPQKTGGQSDVASDRDLDGQYGDPEVRYTVSRWDGEQHKGQKFSECPADFLGALASLLDWTADQAEDENKMTNAGKPVAPYRRMDAARARGWAKRNRAKPPDTEPQQQDGDGFASTSKW